MDKEPTSAPAAMDTRSNKEIPGLTGSRVNGLSVDNNASTELTKLRTNKEIPGVTGSRVNGLSVDKGRSNPCRTNIPINPQVHKQQTPEPIGTVKDIRKEPMAGRLKL